jgi:hypothetical protein
VKQEEERKGGNRKRKVNGEQGTQITAWGGERRGSGRAEAESGRVEKLIVNSVGVSLQYTE